MTPNHVENILADMRKVIFGGANSLDNFFARKDGSVDWLLFSEDVQQLMAEMWPRVDVMLMGRKTWATSRGTSHES